MSALAFLGYLFSFLGDPRIWIILSIILFIIRMVFRARKKQKLLWAGGFIIFVGISMGMAFLSSYFLKETFHVTRPCSFDTADANYSEYCLEDYSFPSGHSTTGFAAATGLFILFRKKLKPPVSLLIYLVGILPAIGRVLQGVHTFADVFTGAVLGIAFSYVFYFVIMYLYNRFKK